MLKSKSILALIAIRRLYRFLPYLPSLLLSDLHGLPVVWQHRPASGQGKGRELRARSVPLQHQPQEVDFAVPKGYSVLLYTFSGHDAYKLQRKKKMCSCEVKTVEENTRKKQPRYILGFIQQNYTEVFPILCHMKSYIKLVL